MTIKGSDQMAGTKDAAPNMARPTSIAPRLP